MLLLTVTHSNFELISDMEFVLIYVRCSKVDPMSIMAVGGGVEGDSNGNGQNDSDDDSDDDNAIENLPSVQTLNPCMISGTRVLSPYLWGSAANDEVRRRTGSRPLYLSIYTCINIGMHRTPKIARSSGLRQRSPSNTGVSSRFTSTTPVEVRVSVKSNSSQLCFSLSRVVIAASICCPLRCISLRVRVACVA